MCSCLLKYVLKIDTSKSELLNQLLESLYQFTLPTALCESNSIVFGVTLCRNYGYFYMLPSEHLVNWDSEIISVS